MLAADYPESGFVDVPRTAWFAKAVDFVKAEGLMNGVGDNRFDPNGAVTRAMVVTVLWRLAGEPAPSGAPPFADVPAGAWYAAPVAWAAEQEIVRGTSATGFSPLEPVTREQFAALLCRFARWSGAAGTEAGEDASPGADEEVPPEDGIPEALRPFPDAAEVSPYARAAMAWAVETGLLRGEPHGGALWLCPQKTATRSQAAALLMRYCVRLGTGD